MVEPNKIIFDSKDFKPGYFKLHFEFNQDNNLIVFIDGRADWSNNTTFICKLWQYNRYSSYKDFYNKIYSMSSVLHGVRTYTCQMYKPTKK